MSSRITEIKAEMTTLRHRLRELSLELHQEFQTLCETQERSLFDVLEEFGDEPEPEASDPKPFYCASCNGWRPHLILDEPGAEAGTVRQMIHCQVCDVKANAPGIHCRKCGRTNFKVKFVRHPREGRTYRSKQCKDCGERLGTIERVTGLVPI